MKKLFVGLMMLAMVLATAQVWGATVYVKPGAANPTTLVQYKSGAASCSEVGGWTDNSNLQAALTAATTLNICAGTYTGTMIDSSGGLDTTAAGQIINGIGAAVIDSTGVNYHTLYIKHDNVVVNTITLKGNGASYYTVKALTDTNSVLNDVVFGGGDSTFLFNSGTPTAILNRCTIKNYTSSTVAGASITTGTLTANYCLWDNLAGPISVTGGTLNINNSVVTGARLEAIKASDGATTINNSVFIANSMGNDAKYIITRTGGTLALNNSIVLPSPFIPQTYFLNGVTESNNLYVSPKWTSARRIGYISPGIDDSANFAHWKTVADYANSKGVGISFIADATQSYSAQNFADMATYVASGNEIIDHTRHHPILTNMNAITITGKTGTTPTIDIAITQTNDNSALWTGSVLLKEGGSTVKTISVSGDNTLTQLAASISGQSGWTGTVHASATGSCKASGLADVTGQDVATAYVALFEQDKFWYQEIAESKKDLETGIGGGYIVKTFAAPNNATTSTLQTWLATDSNFTSAGTTAFTIARGGPDAQSSFVLSDDFQDSYSGSVGLKIMKVISLDLQSLYSDNAVRSISLMEGLQWVGGYAMTYSHGADQYSVAKWETLIDLILTYPKMSIITPSAAATIIRTGGLWTDADANGLRWTYSFPDSSDYRLLSSSPAINAGVGVGLTSDYRGMAVPQRGIPDIGAYEFGPGDSGYGGAYRGGMGIHWLW